MMKKLNRILLIDDDAGTNFINKKIIEKAGVTEHIITTKNGKEALDFLIRDENETKTFSDEPLLVFLDINMPIMDGWEFLEAYKNLGSDLKTKIKIILLSTSCNPDDKLRAEKTPEISEFKNKPLTPKALNDILQTHFILGH